MGTSSVVYPAAMFAPQVAARGVPVAEFNMEITPATEQFGLVKFGELLTHRGSWRVDNVFAEEQNTKYIYRVILRLILMISLLSVDKIKRNNENLIILNLEYIYRNLC